MGFTQLPQGFQRSEFLRDKGQVDIIIDRREMRDRLASIMAMLLHAEVQQQKA